MSKLEQSTGRQDLHLVPPTELTIVTDKADPLYDERINMPLDENLVKNIMMYGVKEPVLIRRDGKALKVVAGRQRTRAAIEANKRLVKEGKEAMAIRCIIERADDATMFGIMISENEARQDDDALVRAEKLQRFMAMGKTEEEAAVTFAKPLTQIKALLKLGDCSPKVRAAIKAEKVSVSAAAKLSELDRDEQDKELDGMLVGVKDGKKATFKEVYKKVQKKKGGKAESSDAPSKKEIRLLILRRKADMPKEAYDALRWALTGEVHGCIRALLKGNDDAA